MEIVIYQSPKKHRIIAIQDLLIKNKIPITSIKLHICVNSRDVIVGGRRANVVQNIVQIERSDELNVPIEEFNEKLNDAQTFEIYTETQYEEAAIELIERCDEETFFDDCIFKSSNYDEAFEISLFLNRNGVPCDDVFTNFTEDNSEEYLLFVEPDDKETAAMLIDQTKKIEKKTYEPDYTERREIFHKEDNRNTEKRLSRFVLPLIIIACLLLLRINDEFIIEIVIRKIEAIIGSSL
ncbi:MAG: hypothetical protein LBI06_03240 [Treponema sp.]|jgi:hypothetical protein|nr:hypothetical protein [Treponema sp.]